MKDKIKSVIGYTFAVLAFTVILLMFINLNDLSKKFAEITEIKVSPWCTGGKVEKVIEHDKYKTLIRQPVFEGLTGPRKEGFIQINWIAESSLPELIKEKIDYNDDNNPDFMITLNTNTGKVNLTPMNPSVLSLEHSFKLGKKAWAVRIGLENITN